MTGVPMKGQRERCWERPRDDDEQLRSNGTGAAPPSGAPSVTFRGLPAPSPLRIPGVPALGLMWLGPQGPRTCSCLRALCLPSPTTVGLPSGTVNRDPEGYVDAFKLGRTGNAFIN